MLNGYWCITDAYKGFFLTYVGRDIQAFRLTDTTADVTCFVNEKIYKNDFIVHKLVDELFGDYDGLKLYWELNR